MITDRKNFSKIKEVIDPPNLIQNQLDSFREFLQADAAPSKRKKMGLEAVFQEVFPIESFDGNCRLEYVSYKAIPPQLTEMQCIREGITYAASLYVTLRLCEEDTVKEEEIYMGELPIIRNQDVPFRSVSAVAGM